MRMTARGGAMAAMGYLPVQLAADNKTPDTESFPPVNHDCQHIPRSLQMPRSNGNGSGGCLIWPNRRFGVAEADCNTARYATSASWKICQILSGSGSRDFSCVSALHANLRSCHNDKKWRIIELGTPKAGDHHRWT